MNRRAPPDLPPAPRRLATVTPLFPADHNTRAAEPSAEPLPNGAEVIPLVQLPSRARPTPIASLDLEEVTRCRALDCTEYNRCLEFVARVRWKSFHCRQCPLSQSTPPPAIRAKEA